jgi:hypothetical protein
MISLLAKVDGHELLLKLSKHWIRKKNFSEAAQQVRSLMVHLNALRGSMPH